jgi:hypothetical protein
MQLFAYVVFKYKSLWLSGLKFKQACMKIHLHGKEGWSANKLRKSQIRKFVDFVNKKRSQRQLLGLFWDSIVECFAAICIKICEFQLIEDWYNLQIAIAECA